MKGFNELVTSLNQISGQWIPSHRTHDTGIGKTLEDLLGIPENNFPGPNGERVELKSMRKNSGQRYIYTAPLLEVGFACAFHQVAFNADKFKSREESNILDVEK